MSSRIVRAGLALGLASAGAALTAGSAPAQNAPFSAAVQDRGLYFWAGGDYRSVNLPNFSLGLINVVTPTGVFGGQMANYSVRPEGFGAHGGVGFVIPDGTLPAAFGSRLRIELEAAIVNADATQSASDVTTTGVVSVRRLNGLGIVSIGCAGCPATSTLHTDYDAQRYTARIASDYQFGSWRLTPSLAIFAGSTDTGQQFSQVLIGVPAFQPTTYTSATTVKWNDVGVKAGLGAQVDLGWITPGIAGTIGFADRRASLDGNDIAVIAGLGGPALSTIGVAQDTTALLASGEISVEFRPARAVTARIFAGLEYDDSVPGISPPTYTGAIAGPPTSTTAAGLMFSSETSFYAGGSLRVKLP